ncbi:S16 family serine protease [Paenibacillus sp. strain BS8-2]
MRERGSIARRMFVSAGVTTFVMWLLLYAPTPYVVYEPGIAVAAAQLVSLQQNTGQMEDEHPNETVAPTGNNRISDDGGSFVLTAVRLTGPNLWGVVRAGFDPNKDIQYRSKVFGGQSKQQYVERINVVMSDSQATAVQAAYEFAGISYHMDHGAVVPDNTKDKIEIAAKEIGGPSAGLVFALQSIDLLTDGDLTRELRIAATGTIDAQGSIGAIGGIKQKTVSVSRDGADLFLVPKDNEKMAKKTASRLSSDTVIIGVSSLHEAVQTIEDFAKRERQR